MASKGGSVEKIWCVRGGHQKKWPLSLVVTASVIMQTTVPEGQNSVSKVLKIQIFPGENAPGPPYFTIHLTATLPHQPFHNKIQPGKCDILFRLRLV